VPDARVPDARVPDAPVDVAIEPDAAVFNRTRVGLIGLWEFDEMSGTTVADTSDAAPKVPLTVNFGTVTFSASTMTPNGIAVIASDKTPHLNEDVKRSQAVTLEAWVMASAGDQGTLAAPVVIAGLSASINSRNISIMQAGRRWLARVRTTPDNNGKPDLISTADLTPGVMTHLVVIADATHRTLYVDGKPDNADPNPGPPLNWDASHKMVLGNELSQNRQWMGTFALVAMYQQALTDELVNTNYLAGPNGP
jgi:hypothetical protein